MAKIIKALVFIFLFSGIAIAQSWQLDGSDDYICTNIVPRTAIGNGNSFTFETKVQFTKAPVDDNSGTIFCAYDTANEYLWLIYKSGLFYIGFGNQVSTAGSLFYPPTYGWWHVAWVFNAGTGRHIVYIDGISAWDYAIASNGVTSNAKLYIGDFFALNYFAGARFDEIRIWNYARTSAQIASNYNKSIPPDQPGLVAYYNFDEQTGTAKNLTGNTTYNATRVGTWTYDNAPMMRMMR